MGRTQRDEAVREACVSLARIQDFDTTSLPRTEELGSSLDFRRAVDPANDLISLYKQIPRDAVRHLNQQFASTLKNRSNIDFKLFNDVLTFDANQSNPSDARDNLIKKIEDAYNGSFNDLHPIISYTTGRHTDFAKLGDDARAAIQEIEDKAEALKTDLIEKSEQAKSILAEIRETAAEQGVSQQAIYFGEEHKKHSDAASTWLKATICLTIGLAFYALATIFLHKWPLLSPEDAYETTQLAVGKVLVFATIASFLVLSGKNYMAHKHNAVVNKHRQNALVTYRALVDAGGDSANRDIVLARAADCIFSDQPSGFSNLDGTNTSSAPHFTLSPSGISAGVG